MDTPILNPRKVGIRVTCAKCGYTKKPNGRSAPICPVFCDGDCDGYWEPPHVDSLWPGESEADFGFQAQNYGVIIQ